MGKRVALVACVGKKEAQPMAARDLYASDWFRKASAYAAREADEWYILSARYGLVSPDRVIAPYDETLKRMPAAARREWARKVLNALALRLEPGDTVIVLAGQAYRAGLVEPLQTMGCHVLIPMEGLRIGQQLAWLKRQIGVGEG
jgi:hypothetical protein